MLLLLSVLLLLLLLLLSVLLLVLVLSLFCTESKQTLDELKMTLKIGKPCWFEQNTLSMRERPTVSFFN